jgi:hypothetical protein
MAVWTIARLEIGCHGCGQRVVAGSPVCLLTSQKIARCQSCAGLLGYTAPADLVDGLPALERDGDDWGHVNPKPALPFEGGES